MSSHRFQCPCGKVNQFTAGDGEERTVKVRCGACKQVCRMSVPASKTKQRTNELMDAILGSKGGFSDLFRR